MPSPTAPRRLLPALLAAATIALAAPGAARAATPHEPPPPARAAAGPQTLLATKRTPRTATRDDLDAPAIGAR